MIEITPAQHTSHELPDWLQRTAGSPSVPVLLEGRRPNRFLERTLGELTLRAGKALQSESTARRPGLLQSLDPRAKLVSFFGLIGLVSCLNRFSGLLLVCALTLVLAQASRLSVGAWAGRVWLSVPIFVGAITLPALLNVVTPGRELLLLWRHPHLAITLPGLQLALRLTLRVGDAVSLATLLTMTTPWNDLLRALRALCVPRLFVSVLAMTYRYLTVLMQAAGEMFVARQSRTVGWTSNREGRRFVGASIGALFSKTLALSEEVHAAMLSRGFTGEMRTLTRFRWRRIDLCWLAGVALFTVLVWGTR